MCGCRAEDGYVCESHRCSRPGCERRKLEDRSICARHMLETYAILGAGVLQGPAENGES